MPWEISPLEPWNCMHVCMLSRFSHVGLCNAMDCSPPGYSVHGILQRRTMEWVPVSYSRGSSQSWNGTCVSCISCIARQILYHWATGEAHPFLGGFQKPAPAALLPKTPLCPKWSQQHPGIWFPRLSFIPGLWIGTVWCGGWTPSFQASGWKLTPLPDWDPSLLAPSCFWETQPQTSGHFQNSSVR